MEGSDGNERRKNNGASWKQLIYFSAVVSALVVLVTVGRDVIRTQGFVGITPERRLTTLEESQIQQAKSLEESTTQFAEYQEAHNGHHVAELGARRLEEDAKAESRQARTLLIEGLVIGECLERSASLLARQRLIQKCRELGVEPRDSS